MPLTLLAPEIILLLLPLIQKQDVSSLSKTCKRLRSVVLGQLYKSIHWRWNIDDGIYRQWNPTVLSSPPIHLLLRSLMQNLELGKAVERITFEGPKINGMPKATATVWAAEGPTELTTSEIENTIQWAQKFQLIPPELFRDALLRGDIDAYVCIVLGFLPNIRSLNLSAEFILFNSKFLGLLFNQVLQRSNTKAKGASPFGAIPHFSSLREVNLGYTTKESSSWSRKSLFEDMYSFFYLPSLEDLTIYLPRSANFSWPEDPLKRAPMRSLTSLSLPSCEANEHALEQLLASKPPLKKLVYNYSCAEPVDAFGISRSTSYYLQLPTLYRAFSYVQSTLESLTFSFEHQAIDAEDYPAYRHSHGLFNGIVASFSQFPCLTYLELPFLMLTGWEVVPRDIQLLAEMLPSSIRHLCLTDNLADWRGSYWQVRHWLERLQDLLATREESIGKIAGGLEVIEMKRESTVMEWESEEEELFKGLGQWYGVETFFSDHFSDNESTISDLEP